MNSHQRWTEKCDRCNLPAKGTAKEWIDGTRVCSFCRLQLISDLEYFQQKIHETYRLRVYPIIRRKETYIFKEVKNLSDIIDDIAKRNKDENS